MNNKRFALLSLFLGLILVCTACTSPAQPDVDILPVETEKSLPTDTLSPTAPQAQDVMVQRSQKNRNAEVQVPEADLKQLVQGNTAFALDLYQVLSGQEGNLFLSPYSITQALAMTYAGAKGNTEAQMAKTLHFDLPQENLHPAFNALDQLFASRAEIPAELGGEGFRLNLANALWGQTGYTFIPDFLDRLAENYGAGMNLVDYQQDPEAARKLINDWVANATEDKIQDLIPQGGVNDLTRLVLTNAIYFNAAWQSPFEEKETKQGPFTLLDGSQVQVPMMRQTEYLNYTAQDQLTVVEIPYLGGQMSMVILLPDAGAMQTVEQNLTADTLSGWLSAMQSTNLELQMPKFKVESSFSLSDAFKALGMSDAFDPAAADFSGMDGTRNLYITGVLHKAFVDVNEAGTEAAAATAVMMGVTSMPLEPVQVTVDRPFLFLIRDMETGAILFMGRVVQP